MKLLKLNRSDRFRRVHGAKDPRGQVKYNLALSVLLMAAKSQQLTAKSIPLNP
jgi:hypothetical protein